MKSAAMIFMLLLLLLLPLRAEAALSDKQTTYRVLAGKEAAEYRYNDYLADETTKRANFTAFIQCALDEATLSSSQLAALPGSLQGPLGISFQTNLMQRSLTLMSGKKTEEITGLLRNRYRSLLRKGGRKSIALGLTAHAAYIEALRNLPAWNACQVLREWRLAGWDNTVLEEKMVPYGQIVLLSSKLDRAKKQLEKSETLMNAVPGVDPSSTDFFEMPISYKAIEMLAGA